MSSMGVPSGEIEFPGGGGGKQASLLASILFSGISAQCKTTNMADQDGQQGQKVKDLIDSFRSLDNVEKTLFMLSCVKECKVFYLLVLYV